MTGDEIDPKKMMYPDESDIQVATRVRMLMRDQLDHEAVCTGARDRIMYLSQQVERLNDANDALIEIGHRQAERMERLYARVDELERANEKFGNQNVLDERNDEIKRLTAEHKKLLAQHLAALDKIERLTAEHSGMHMLMNEAADDLHEWVESYGDGVNDSRTKDLIKHLRESTPSGRESS